MESYSRVSHARARVATAVLCAVAVVAGCGDEDDYENRARPPAPIVVSAAITDDGVSVSPRRFGAGPINLVVANQTDAAQKVTLETDELGGSQAGIQQETGPINPGDTASLKADLRRGTYRVAVDGSEIDDAALRVGAPRPSSQNDLLQP